MKSCTAHTPTQKVVVVNGSAEALSVLETLLDAGHYDMVFVESSDRAYSTIKRVLPNLIVVCTRVEALDGVQLLTMLKLDPATKDIPVLSYTSEDDGQDSGFRRRDLRYRRRARHAAAAAGGADELTVGLQSSVFGLRSSVSSPACYSPPPCHRPV